MENPDLSWLDQLSCQYKLRIRKALSDWYPCHSRVPLTGHVQRILEHIQTMNVLHPEPPHHQLPVRAVVVHALNPLEVDIGPVHVSRGRVEREVRGTHDLLVTDEHGAFGAVQQGAL